MNKTFLPLVAVAATGGLIGGGVTVLLDGGDGKTTTRTVVQQAPVAGTRPASDSSGLTPRDIYKRDAPGVVTVRAQVVRQSTTPFDFGFDLPQQQQGTSTGSGFVVDKKGYILTNFHVIDGASKVTVTFEHNKSANADIVGRDAANDLALLKVDPSGQPLEPLALGDDKSVQVGDPTIAIGNPFGLDRTLTTGVVSALQRQIDSPSGFSINHVIQTDAPINPGNSGGPLIDATGRVIGINSQIATGGSSSGNVGIGFAVPIDTVKRVLPELKKTGQVSRAFLGITGATIDSSFDRLNLSVKQGVLVQDVTRNSPADKAGIRGGDTTAQLGTDQLSLGGDVITKIDSKAVASMDGVVDAVLRHKPGDKVDIEIVRNGKHQTVTAKLAQAPNRTATVQ
jgi:S1-C subfamily serine protease